MLRKNFAILSLLSLTLATVSMFAMEGENSKKPKKNVKTVAHIIRCENIHVICENNTIKLQKKIDEKPFKTLKFNTENIHNLTKCSFSPDFEEFSLEYYVVSSKGNYIQTFSVFNFETGEIIKIIPIIQASF